MPAQRLMNLDTSANPLLAQNTIPVQFKVSVSSPPSPEKNSEIYFSQNIVVTEAGGTSLFLCLMPGLFLFSEKCLWTETVNRFCVSAISPVSLQGSSQPTQASSDLSPASAPALCSHPPQPSSSSFSILKLLGWFNPYLSHNYRTPFSGAAGQHDSHWDAAALGRQHIPPLLPFCLFLLPLELLRISRGCC